MRAAIITVAGISSRFNEGIPEAEKVLKAIFSDDGAQNTLLYHLLVKCSYADRIIIVGGYKYKELCDFFSNELSISFPQTILIKNEHYEDLASGYSLYLGIKEAVKEKADEILFVEGDLDIDAESFNAVVNSEHSVVTYTNEPIYANKAVVLYQNQNGNYQYAFNSEHGFLTIKEPFSCILNSGQVWKFRKTDILKEANDEFYRSEMNGTNLRIIQRYIDAVDTDTLDLICLRRWTNCNTRQDYYKIQEYWR